ncbi:hypothetical protein GCM10018963_01320 [Saccharothrix longispora]
MVADTLRAMESTDAHGTHDAHPIPDAADEPRAPGSSPSTSDLHGVRERPVLPWPCARPSRRPEPAGPAGRAPGRSRPGRGRSGPGR